MSRAASFHWVRLIAKINADQVAHITDKMISKAPEESANIYSYASPHNPGTQVVSTSAKQIQTVATHVSVFDTKSVFTRSDDGTFKQFNDHVSVWR